MPGRQDCIALRIAFDVATEAARRQAISAGRFTRRAIAHAARRAV
jgi:hypothetical protein